jgi:hypothetical protein
MTLDTRGGCRHTPRGSWPTSANPLAAGISGFTAQHDLPDRSNPTSVNPRTGRAYCKLTAESIPELIAWARLNLPALKELGEENYCKTCAPRG